MTSHPGPHLRELIDKTGLRQVTVARQVGVTTKHLNQILQGRALPSLLVTIALARVLRADPHALWRMVADYQIDRALGVAREDARSGVRSQD
jgi:DNA-binding XRE family transcriptional regulator